MKETCCQEKHLIPPSGCLTQDFLQGPSGTAFESQLKLKYADAKTNYSSYASVLVAGRLGGKALHWYSDYTSMYLKVAVTGSPSELVVGFAYRTPTYQGGNNLVSLLNSSGAEICKLSIDYYNRLLVSRAAVTVAEMNTPLSPETWYYVEWKIKPDNSAGSTEVRVNGETVCSATGVDTQNQSPPITQVQFHAQDSEAYLDDIYICDTTGTVNNDFLGPCLVESLFPSADTTDADFLPSAGTDHYALVDEIPCDYDISYVESNTAGDQDIWAYENLSTIDGTVFAVQVWTQAAATTGSFTLKTVADDGVTQNSDSGKTVSTTTYIGALRVLDKTPSNTSWTLAAINASLFGVGVG